MFREPDTASHTDKLPIAFKFDEITTNRGLRGPGCLHDIVDSSEPVKAEKPNDGTFTLLLEHASILAQVTGYRHDCPQVKSRSVT